MADPKGSDFNIHKPVAPAGTPPGQLPQGQFPAGTAQPAPSPAGTMQPGPATTPHAGASSIMHPPLPVIDPDTGLSSGNTVIGVAIVLALALLFFFVRGGLRSHLIAHRASPSAAGSAGWALFAFLLALSVTVVFGVLGSLWQVLTFLVPMGALVTVTLIIFALLYSSAARGRR